MAELPSILHCMDREKKGPSGRSSRIFCSVSSSSGIKSGQTCPGITGAKGFRHAHESPTRFSVFRACRIPGNKKHAAFDRLKDNSCLARDGLIPAKQGIGSIGGGPKARRPAADSLRPGFGAVLHIGWQVTFQYDISELYSSSGFQNPIDFPETGRLQRRKIDNTV